MEWKRAAQRPKGLHPATHAALPAAQSLRLVHLTLSSPGYRSTDTYLVTTLLDCDLHDARQIASWYLRRWEIELSFDDIKTSLGMHTLRCKSPHMLARELLMHMIAYNLVRSLILCVT